MSISFDKALGIHEQALGFRAKRAEVLANNIANADTPNYKAVDFDFGSALREASEARPGASTAVSSKPQLLYRTPSQSALDGNSVEADAERAKLADNAVRYEAALRVLTGQIKTMLSAIQG